MTSHGLKQPSQLSSVISVPVSVPRGEFWETFSLPLEVSDVVSQVVVSAQDPVLTKTEMVFDNCIWGQHGEAYRAKGH